MILRELELSDEVAFETMTEAWEDHPSFNLLYGLFDEMDFSWLIQTMKNSYDQSSLYAFIGAEIIGKVSIRHKLDPNLGHIGYGVIPLKRGRGYASQMLAQSLVYCGGLGLKQVLLISDEQNLASARVIEKLGGVLESVIDGKKRYWIEIQK